MRDQEHKEGVAFMKWCKARESIFKGLHLIYHIPNGGQRHRLVGAKLKAEGVNFPIVFASSDQDASTWPCASADPERVCIVHRLS